ncbi:MAG: T9SS type A sorting domain-containing protein, partial [Bacteroidales bacterium]|nr:T9SS type A sorting domain-containing protein [Bacteroidales bacterium]
NIVEVVAPAGFAAYQWYINPSNNPDLAAVAITANEIPAIYSGTNDTLFVTQESNIMQGQPLQHVFVKLTSASTTVGVPACISYQSIDITDTKPRPDFTYQDSLLDVTFINNTDESVSSRRPDYYKWEFGDNTPDVEWNAPPPELWWYDNDTLKSPTHIYAADGTYDVTLTAGKNGCMQTITKTIALETNSIGNVDIDNFTFYPNPATKELNIDCSAKIEAIEVFNTTGQQIYVSKVNDKNTTIDVSNFTKGNYVAKLYTDNGITTKKFVVE